MSFQGDVGGIGLAELLQSLARGRREGLLRLHTKSGLKSTLGLHDGVISFLPDDEEDSNIWKERSRQAWIHDHDYRIDAMRMSDIARAHRIENIYSILDSEEVHFRFNPGEQIRKATAPISDASGDGGPNQARSPEVYCDGMAVEMFLLEYARLSDESEGLKEQLGFTSYVVPRVLDGGGPLESPDRFLSECDGTSTLAELSDRLGMPIRQTRLVFLSHVNHSRIRLAGHRELLVLAQRELSQGHVRRAAARLVGWIQASPPGPLEEGDAGLLAAEFKADRMGPLLNLMPAKEARTLLRRLDHALQDTEASVRHWRELHRLKRKERIVEIHRLGCEFAWEDDPEVPTLRELLDTAKELREDDTPWRAAAFLHMAASRDPANANSRLDIGSGMLNAGLVEEATVWILDGAQTLVAAGHPNKAIPALRALLEVDGSIREARRMLARLKHLTVRRQLIRKNSLVGFAIVMVIGAAAWVQITSQQDKEIKLAEVADLIETPTEASALLEAYFVEDNSERVQNLREMIFERRKYNETTWRNDWNAQYIEASRVCRDDAPLEGLKLAFALSKPPVLTTIAEDWSSVTDLFNGLAVRLESEHDLLGPLELDGTDQTRLEKELKAILDDVITYISEDNVTRDLGDLEARLETISVNLVFRIKERSRLLDERAHSELRYRQDLMLAGARADDNAGNLAKALEVYELLLETDESGRLEEIMAEEINDLKERFKALTVARDLASEGKHTEAIAMLHEAFGDRSQHSLPWLFDVFPAGALVHLADGSKRQAPFIYESQPGEELSFTVEHPGHLAEQFEIDDPADIKIWLSKIPERSWAGAGRIDALPVSIGGDQIVADRTGLLARISKGGEIVWKLSLQSLGGIARAPVSLPQSPERLLLVTEDGDAWLLNGDTGEYEGPWRLDAGPLEGPSPTADAVVARIKGGRLMRWTNRVRPTEVFKISIPEADAHGTLGGLAVMHRGEAGRQQLDNPWNNWTVELIKGAYRIYDIDHPEAGFAVKRMGAWSYLAWEAPTPETPEGRLWISDAGGIAGYLP